VGLTEQGHHIYTANKLRGGTLYLWGRCTCGAVLDDRAAIDRHRAEHAEKRAG
jgi:hypothetical protein